MGKIVLFKKTDHIYFHEGLILEFGTAVVLLTIGMITTIAVATFIGMIIASIIGKQFGEEIRKACWIISDINTIDAATADAASAW
jgi:ABC-type enterochelin transport system permease subunit